MAGIRKGVGIVGKVQTQVGEKILVQMANNGGIGVRNPYKPSTSHSDKQLEGQMRSTNVMAFYKLVKDYVPHLWQEQVTVNKKTGAKHKARPVDLFKQANMQAEVPVYGMSPKEYDKGGVVLAPYQMSQGDLGSMEDVRCNKEDGTPERLWEMETVGELAQVLLAGNAGWKEGDVLYYIEMEPYMERGVAKAKVGFAQVPMWADSEQKLSELGALKRGFAIRDGRLGDRGDAEVAYCYVRGSLGADKKVHFTTGYLCVDAIQAWLDRYREPECVEAAMAGFRAQAEEREKAKMAAYEQKQHGLTKEDIKEAVKEAVVEALREVLAEWKG